MPAQPFFQIQLRTRDVDAARAFYTAVLGDRPLQILQLHEQAVARGAPPHWLGSLEVDDVDTALATFSARGAMPLSPKWVNPEGLEGATVRDPGGAVLGLVKPSPESRETAKRLGPEVVSCVLNTNDVATAKRNYAELAGWAFGPPADLGALGVLHPFSLAAGGPEVGAMIDIAGRTHVHPHWLFQLRAADLEHALGKVRSLGGVIAGVIDLPGGDRLAVCDDPQGAAFGLRQSLS